ncbi:MAG: ATP-binding cassette domain-containing protein [Gammaproteobacteria bacterium]|nr:ATP-binding cassette domain-containing protein [Gammaproteobacteria bacterium]
MLKLDQVSLRRGVRELLTGATVSIHAGQRVGVTGANGVGKSSLFALVRGELHADMGEVYIPSATVIAHVAQETPPEVKPAIEYVIDGDLPLRKLQVRLQEAEASDNGGLIAQLHADLEAAEAYTANSRAAKLLTGLGFSTDQQSMPVKQFSGGWRMRLNLAQALMCRSDMLLLDEPTNHLDMETVIWLEDWLRAYSGTLLLISHDRDFLDRVVTHIAHIENGELRLYTGNYSDFETARAVQLSQQQAAYQKQQSEIAHMRKFIDRFGAKATKARQAQSRMKALERMATIAPAHVDSPFQFTFHSADNVPNPLLVLDEVQAGYGANTILREVRSSIRAGDRIGLLGSNGAGKSTLIKLLAGELAPLQGKRTGAADLRIGYFAQHQLEQLDAEASPMLHLQRLDPKASEKTLRSFLGGFAFSGDMATASVGNFSGGEKARLVLAMIVYQRPNLLLLDEPTNHLDLEMRLALTVALQEFEGAMIIVSHDRHLLRTVADTLWLVAGGKVTDFDGDLEDYRLWVQEQQRLDSGLLSDAPASSNKKQQRQQAAEQRKKTQPLRNKLKSLEKTMAEQQQRLTELELVLGDGSLYDASNKSRLQSLMEEQRQVQSRLSDAEMDWLDTTEALEALERE